MPFSWQGSGTQPSARSSVPTELVQRVPALTTRFRDLDWQPHSLEKKSAEQHGLHCVLHLTGGSVGGCSTSANSTSDNSTSASWPKSKLAEVEIGRSRNWPKSKLIGRSRTDGVCSVSSFSLSFFSFALFFTFLYFFLFLLISLFILFCSISVFVPELNPKPRTLHSISDGPFRWTPPPVNPPSPDNPSPDNPSPDNPPPDNPPPDNPKFRFFFPSSCHNFHSSFSLLGSFRGILLVFEGRNPEMCTFGVLGLSCETPAAPPDQAAGASHDSPRTPNVHISGPHRFKHHQNSTKGPQESERRKKIVAEEGKKKREILGPTPFGAPPFRAPPFWAPPFWAPPFWAPPFWAPPFWAPPFWAPPFGLHPSGPHFF